MMRDDVTGGLLRSVSRTFSVSVRVLPPALREPVGIAYLLARASDTIADAEGCAADVRARRLDDFEALLRSGADPGLLAAIRRDVHPAHTGERALLDRLPQVIARFTALSAADRRDMLDLLTTIVAGQRGDVLTFADPGRITALPDAAALETYIHAVAGCVGEWWTRMGFRHIPRYARCTEHELLPSAAALGQALQVVNILRDLPADLRAGRCYLPLDELRACGADPARLLADPAPARPVVAAWSARARDRLDRARDAIRAVRPWRVRFACYVPWRLAGQTLDLVAATPPLETTTRVKVSRKQVRVTLSLGLWAAVSDRPLR